MKNIIIFGATSSIAQEIAKLYAMEHANFYLIARNKSKLESIKKDLVVRGANNVYTDIFDANNFETHKDIIEQAFKALGDVHLLLLAHGNLPNQELCQSEPKEAIEAIRTNGLSIISLLTHAANKMIEQSSGNIAVITSVAGDRGRKSNYVYGAAKGMVSIFLQGLSQRLYAHRVNVLDIKPGFIDTPMTADFQKGILWTSPKKVAHLIKKRIENNTSFSYVPSFWFPIMTIIKLIPHKFFRKMEM